MFGLTWDQPTHLLALIAELADQNNRLLFRANFKGQPPPPITINRPGVQSLPAEATAPRPMVDPEVIKRRISRVIVVPKEEA